MNQQNNLQEIEQNLNFVSNDQMFEPLENNEMKTNKIDDSNKLSKQNDIEQEMKEINISESPNKILQSEDIDKTELCIMKGDTIGETLYSAKWILKTLISLTKVHESGWNESMENELCILWDMSQEKEIVQYLIENDFYKIADLVLKTSDNNRLTVKYD